LRRLENEVATLRQFVMFGVSWEPIRLTVELESTRMKAKVVVLSLLTTMFASISAAQAPGKYEAKLRFGYVNHSAGGGKSNINIWYVLDTATGQLEACNNFAGPMCQKAAPIATGATAIGRFVFMSTEGSEDVSPSNRFNTVWIVDTSNGGLYSCGANLNATTNKVSRAFCTKFK
jgi:hypothetical protein